MPVYAQIADLVTRYGQAEIEQLTDRLNPPAGVIDAAVADRALADADAEIDAYLRVRYTLPLAAVPEVVRRIACDIARYRLWEDRASDEVRRRYEDAVRVLEALAAGRVSLGLAQSAAAEPKGVSFRAPGRTMTTDMGY